MYNSDGASRLQPENSRKASFGAELCVNGDVVARYGVFIGDRTNNEAEYSGILATLRHALALRPARVCFRVDNKLVCEQLCGRWACRAPYLVAMYEACVGLIGDIKAMLGTEDIIVEHVYREYKAGADSLANVAIDNYNPGAHVNGVVVNENWQPYAPVR